MGGLEGRAYSGSNDPWTNTKLRYYRDYVKPEIDKQERGGQIFGALGSAYGLLTGQNPFKMYKKGAESYEPVRQILAPTKEDITRFHTRNNAPDDLSGTPVWSKTTGGW